MESILGRILERLSVKGRPDISKLATMATYQEMRRKILREQDQIDREIDRCQRYKIDIPDSLVEAKRYNEQVLRSL